jgi:adenylate cyclase
MAEALSSDMKLEIGHVLFIDIVGYSKLLITEQSGQIQTLREIVRGTEQFRQAQAEGKLLRLPTGDGGALVFRTTPEAPVLCAIEISKVLKNHPELRVRMGIHSGPVNEITDLNEQANIAGAGINIAQRVMDCGDAGHILLSRHVAEDLEHYPRWRSDLHELGECEVKHGIRISVVNLYNDEVGNLAVPEKFKAVAAAVSAAPMPVIRKWALIGAAILILTAIATFLFWQRAKRPTSAIPEKSIAVLPFQNMSADKNDEYLSDGMTEELINVLAKVPGLHVPGRTSCFAFKGRNEENIFQKVGKQLHVATVLEGSVRKAGQKLRVTAQLISVADGYHLWSKDYDGDVNDLLNFQSNVAEQVVHALQVQLGSDEARALAKLPTENPEAHRLYLLGRYHFGKDTKEDFITAIHYFQQALQVDPNYALAYCGLADTYGYNNDLGIQGKESWAKGKYFAEKALALDPDLADAHASLGTALGSAFDWVGCETEIKRALELNPNVALAYDTQAWLLTIFGRFDEARPNIKKELELDPLNPLLSTSAGFYLYLARRYDEGIAQFRRTLELNPTNPVAHSNLASCLICKGDPAGAAAEIEKANSVEHSPSYDDILICAYALSGDRAKAQHILNQVNEAKGQVGLLAYIGLGDKAKALDCLEKSCEDQGEACWSLKVDPIYDSLRDEPRFQVLLKKMGFDK